MASAVSVKLLASVGANWTVANEFIGAAPAAGQLVNTCGGRVQR